MLRTEVKSTVLEWVCLNCGKLTVARDKRLGIEPGVCVICEIEYEVATCFQCGLIMNLMHEGEVF